MVQYVKAHEEVILGLKNYIRFSQNLGNGSSVRRYSRPVIDYWSNVIEEIRKEIVSEAILFGNFGQKLMNVINYKAHYGECSARSIKILGLEELNDHFCGPQ